jgi:hypothetical protein
MAPDAPDMLANYQFEEKESFQYAKDRSDSQNNAILGETDQIEPSDPTYDPQGFGLMFRKG